MFCLHLLLAVMKIFQVTTESGWGGRADTRTPAVCPDTGVLESRGDLSNPDFY